jgi:hypothetical protein
MSCFCAIMLLIHCLIDLSDIQSHRHSQLAELAMCTRQDGKPSSLCADKSENTMTRKAAFTSNQSQTHRFLSLTANGLPVSSSKEYQLGNQVIDGSLPEVDIALMFARAKDAMTGQAKARGSSPFGKVLSYFQTLTRTI